MKATVTGKRNRWLTALRLVVHAVAVGEHDDRAAPGTGLAGGGMRVGGAIHQREDGVARAAHAVVLGGDERVRLSETGSEQQDHRDGCGEGAALAALPAGQ